MQLQVADWIIDTVNSVFFILWTTPPIAPTDTKSWRKMVTPVITNKEKNETLLLKNVFLSIRKRLPLNTQNKYRSNCWICCINGVTSRFYRFAITNSSRVHSPYRPHTLNKNSLLSTYRGGGNVFKWTVHRIANIQVCIFFTYIYCVVRITENIVIRPFFIVCYVGLLKFYKCMNSLLSHQIYNTFYLSKYFYRWRRMCKGYRRLLHEFSVCERWWIISLWMQRGLPWQRRRLRLDLWVFL